MTRAMADFGLPANGFSKGDEPRRVLGTENEGMGWADVGKAGEQGLAR